jgi:hypothetical protein
MLAPLDRATVGLTKERSKMSCNSTVQTTTSQQRVVFSRSGATNQGVSSIFVLTPESLIQLAPSLSQLRVTLVTSNLSENAEVTPVIETTDDGCTWLETTTQFTPGTWVDTDSVTTYSWWTAVDELKRGVRLGVKIRQSSGTALEGAVVQAVIDWETK